MEVISDAYFLNVCGACAFFASKLAPTEGAYDICMNKMEYQSE